VAHKSLWRHAFKRPHERAETAQSFPCREYERTVVGAFAGEERDRPYVMHERPEGGASVLNLSLEIDELPVELLTLERMQAPLVLEHLELVQPSGHERRHIARMQEGITVVVERSMI